VRFLHDDTVNFGYLAQQKREDVIVGELHYELVDCTTRVAFDYLDGYDVAAYGADSTGDRA